MPEPMPMPEPEVPPMSLGGGHQPDIELLAVAEGGLARSLSSKGTAGARGGGKAKPRGGGKRALQVAVLECRSLKKMDGRFGQNDAFVTVDVDGEAHTSSTVHDGGAAPRWDGGAGELLTFRPPKEPNALVVQVWDEDDKKNQLIGTEHVSLKNASAATNAGYDWSSCEWYRITDDKDNVTGEVRLFLRWAVPLPRKAPMEWQLEVTVIEAKDLKKMDLVGKNDVYVRVHAHGAKTTERTTTLEDAGTNPQWGTEHTPGEAVTLTMAGVPPSLGIEVWEEDVVKSDMIGCHVLDVGTLIDPTKNGSGWSWDGWSSLTNYKEGKSTGEVRVRLDWRYVPVDEVEEVEFRHLKVTVLECRDLKNMDGFRGRNDVYVIGDLQCTGNEHEALTSSVVDDGGGKCSSNLRQFLEHSWNIPERLLVLTAAPRWSGGAGEELLFS